MRAYSSKKYREPIDVGNALVLVSKDGTEELRVMCPIKYIVTDTNKSVIYSPSDYAKGVAALSLNAAK